MAHDGILELPLGKITAKVVARGCVIDVRAARDQTALGRGGYRVWRL